MTNAIIPLLQIKKLRLREFKETCLMIIIKIIIEKTEVFTMHKAPF